jgi:hypothetical protein
MLESEIGPNCDCADRVDVTFWQSNSGILPCQELYCAGGVIIRREKGYPMRIYHGTLMIRITTQKGFLSLKV